MTNPTQTRIQELIQQISNINNPKLGVNYLEMLSELSNLQREEELVILTEK